MEIFKEMRHTAVTLSNTWQYYKPEPKLSVHAGAKLPEMEPAKPCKKGRLWPFRRVKCW